MYGVILWSDPQIKKAVIWCEDQTNLAYYEAPEQLKSAETCFFDAGDYVEFDISMDDNLCRASNAQIVVSGSDPRLPVRLELVGHTDTDQILPRSRAARRARRGVTEVNNARVILLSEHLEAANQAANKADIVTEINRRG